MAPSSKRPRKPSFADGGDGCAQYPDSDQPAGWVERLVRKVYDRRGRHWQSVAFFRRVPPAAVAAAHAAAGRPEVPCLGLLRAAREGLGRADSAERVWLPGGAEPEPAAAAAAHARLAAATRRLFAAHAAAARAAMAGAGVPGGGGGGGGEAVRGWFGAMGRLMGSDSDSPGRCVRADPGSS